MWYNGGMVNSRTSTETHHPPCDAPELTPGEHGFFIDYPNGFRLSVQYGWGNYCDNQSYAPGPEAKHGELGTTRTAEVAVMDYTKEGVPFVGLPMDIASWVPIERLHSIMNAVRCADFRLLCQECDVDYIVDNDPSLSDQDKQEMNEAYAAIDDSGDYIRDEHRL